MWYSSTQYFKARFMKYFVAGLSWFQSKNHVSGLGETSLNHGLFAAGWKDEAFQYIFKTDSGNRHG